MNTNIILKNDIDIENNEKLENIIPEIGDGKNKLGVEQKKQNKVEMIKDIMKFCDDEINDLNYELALECVERIAAWAEDCGSGSPFISIRTCMEPISFNNSLYGYDLSAYRKGNNNNYNSFETITEADILWNLIDKQKDQVNIVFPAKCHLTKTILSLLIMRSET